MMNLEHAPLFFILSLVAAVLQLRAWKSDTSVPASERAFKAFQRNYLTVYLTVMLADWLQGPYVYALYEEYGFSQKEIGILFVAGFGCSGIAGVFIGSFADRFGRKKTCLVFCVMYGMSCVTKHIPDFWILMVGRLLAGGATSILFSGFDAWMVHEHHTRNYDPNWTGQTFSFASFGNGLVAVVAALVASVFAGIFGKVAPFDVALVTLIIGGLTIHTTWNENYGTSEGDGSGGLEGRSSSGMEDLKNVAVMMYRNPSVVWCGLAQSFFEGAMYTFVFMWTPSLPVGINHGLVFGCFMVACMIGSAIFSMLRLRAVSLTLILCGIFVLGAASLGFAAWLPGGDLRLACFVAFEIACGCYFACFYTVRSMIVPDEGRATILNIYRVPLNLIVVSFCVTAGQWETSAVFMFCFILQALGFVMALLLHLQPCAATPSSAIKKHEMLPMKRSGDAEDDEMNEYSSELCNNGLQLKSSIFEMKGRAIQPDFARSPASTAPSEGAGIV